MDERIRRIEHDSNGWRVYYRIGYCESGNRGQHESVADTKQEAFSHGIEKCDCKECEAYWGRNGTAA